MEVYSNILHFNNHKTANIIMYICFQAFIILSFAKLGIQDDQTTVMPKPYSDEDDVRKEFRQNILRTEDNYKLFEIQYSLNSTWEIINQPQFSGLPVLKKIRNMWECKKSRKIVEKKPRIRRKNETTTTASPFGASNISGQSETTTELYETTTRLRLPGRQNPFVLVEGTLTKTRRELLRGLMKQTTFVYVRNFRKYPFKYGDKLYDFKLLPLKRAFITLQFYITGRDVESILEDRPVIMSGFWMRQAAEFIARKYLDKLPPVGSDCYKWPADLVRPDFVFFLHTPRNDTKLQEQTVKRLDRIVEIYQRMNPPVINLDQSYNALTTKQLSKLRKIMMEKIKEKYPYANEYMKYKAPDSNRTSKRKQKKLLKKNINTTITGDETK